MGQGCQVLKLVVDEDPLDIEPDQALTCTEPRGKTARGLETVPGSKYRAPNHRLLAFQVQFRARIAEGMLHETLEPCEFFRLAQEGRNRRHPTLLCKPTSWVSPPRGQE